MPHHVWLDGKQQVDLLTSHGLALLLDFPRIMRGLTINTDPTSKQQAEKIGCSTITAIKKALVPEFETNALVFAGTGIASHPSAQLKLSREHSPQRLTQKPLLRQAKYARSPGGGVVQDSRVSGTVD